MKVCVPCVPAAGLGASSLSLEVVKDVPEVSVSRMVGEGRRDITLPPFEAGKAFGEKPMQKELSVLQRGCQDSRDHVQVTLDHHVSCSQPNLF